MANEAVFRGKDGVLVRVWTVPGASMTAIVGLYGDSVKIRVAAPPEGGKANEALIRLLEGVTGSEVALIRGMSNRKKLFLVTGNDVDSVRRKLGLSG
ncbi:MAG: DUF167 domain-containing protein [Actinomycetota bacterium]|nr:DUF167 domain-containing protein [Actinomycetota bacterium]